MARANNVQNTDGYTWRSMYGKTFWDHFIGELQSAQELDRQSVVDRYNDLQRSHRELRYLHEPNDDGTWPSVTSESGVSNYQLTINDRWGFINEAIGNQFGSAYKMPKSPNSNDNPGNWVNDGYYGGITDHRYVLGRKIGEVDDWTPEELDKKNQLLQLYGYKIELEKHPTNPTIGYYVIKPLNTKGNRKKFEPYQFPPKVKRNIDRWTDWLPLTQLKSIGDWATQKALNIKSRILAPLEEPIIKQYKVTDNYFTTSGLQQKAANILSNSVRGLSSNLDWNANKRQQAQEAADKYFLASMETRQNKYNTDITQALEVANTNTANRVTTRNRKAVALNAVRKILLDNKVEALKEWAANMKSYIGNMYSSAGEFVKAKRYNDMVHENALAKRNYSTELQRINAWVQDQTIGMFTGQNKDNIINILRTAQTLTSDAEQQAGLQKIIDNYDKLASYEAGREAIENALNTTTLGQAWLSNLQERIARMAENQALAAAAARDAILDENTGIKINNLHYPWSPEFHTYSRSASLASPFSILRSKKGGKIIDHTKHRETLAQREAEFVRKSQDEVNKRLMGHLLKEISDLHREELQLLRNIFK